MEIKIDVQNEDGTEKIIFTNEGIDNPNFITMVSGENEQLVLLKDLEAVVIAFNKVNEV